jgi:uncharacterized C2H2 Zn-finger protein
VFPVIKAAGSSVLQEASRAGLGVLSDVSSGRAPLRDSFTQHINQASENLSASLKRKTKKIQGGDGYKRPRTVTKAHLHRTVRAVQTRKKNKAPLLKADIFGTQKKR